MTTHTQAHMLETIASLATLQAEASRQLAELTRLVAQALPRGEADPAPAPEATRPPIVVPAQGTNKVRTLSVIHQWDGDVRRRDLIAFLIPHGLNKNMTSGAIDALKKDGLIAAAGRGLIRITQKGREFMLRRDR